MRRHAGQVTRALVAVLGMVTYLASGAGAEEFIEARSGRLGIVLTDLAVPAGPLVIGLTREFQDTRREPGLLGPGWRLVWESRLAVADTEAWLDEGGIARRLTPDGASGAYVAATGERLTRAPDGRFALVRRDGATDLFDVAGRLVEREHGNGNRLALRYGPDGRLTRIDGPFGAFVVFTHDADGRVGRAESHLGTFVRYVYVGDRLSEVHWSSAARPLRYAYDAAGRLTRIDDPSLGVTDLAYDGAGRVTARQFPDGSRERYEYDDANRVVRQVDARGGVTIRQLSPDGRREDTTDPLGRKTTVERDDWQRPVLLAEPDGRTVAMSYDALGRLTRSASSGGGGVTIGYLGATTLPAAITRPNGGREQLEYDGQRNLTRVTVDGETTLAFTYLPNGLLETVTEPGGRQRHLGYDAAGRLTTVRDGLGRITRYAYDRRGNPARVVDAQGGVRLHTYDAQDRLVAETDPLGGVTRFEYDAGGRLVRVLDPTGAATRLEYDASGARVRVIDAAGRRAELQATPEGLAVRRADGTAEEVRVDALGRLAAVADGLGRRTRFDYDLAGRVLSETAATGRVLKYRYDQRDRPVGVDTGSGGRLTYLWEANDRLAAVVDPTGATERYRYDSRGRLAGVVDPVGQETRLAQDAGGRLTTITTPAGENAQYAYDVEGRLVSSRDGAGRITRLEYDPLDHLVAITGPDGVPVRQAYDRAGRRESASDAAGGTTRFAYDAAGRLLAKTLADGRAVRYRYAPAGDLLEVDDGAYPLRYDYDAGGRLVGVTHAALRKAVRYRYDATGQLAGVAGTSGQELRYRYDGMGRLAGIALPAGGEIGLTFDSADRLESVRYPNGVVGEWRYDPAGRIARIAYRLVPPPGSGQPPPELTLEYRYDVAGNLVEQRGPEATAVRQYRHDAAGRLVEERVGGDVNGYAYHAGGDRAERRDRAGAAAFQYDPAGRLLRAGAQRFAHDAGGRIVRRDGPDGATQYAFDPEGRLVAATTPLGAVGFGYAPTGERVWRRGPDGVQVRYVHDGANLLEELADDGTLRALYVHAPGLDRPLAMIQGSRAVFYHADALGTVRFLTDAGGQLVVRYEVDAFGVLRAALPTAGAGAGNAFILAGREYDPDLGLYYLRARYYDPALGRFLSPDPLLGTLDQPETLNRYAYARNAPTRYVDPLGLAAQSPLEHLVDHYRAVNDTARLEQIYRLRPELRPAPAAPVAPTVTPAPTAPPAAPALPGVTPPQPAAPPAGAAVAAGTTASAAGTAAQGTASWWRWGGWQGESNFLSAPWGPKAKATDAIKAAADAAAAVTKGNQSIFGDLAKGGIIGAGVAAATQFIVTANTPGKTWGDAARAGGWGGLAGGAWGVAIGGMGEAAKQGAIRFIGQAAGTAVGVGISGTLVVAGVAATLHQSHQAYTEGMKRNAAIDEAARNMRRYQQSPAMTPDGVNRALAQLRGDLATLRQLHGKLGAAASGPDPFGPARAKVAQLQGLAKVDPAELQRGCAGLDALVKTLRAAATQVATHARASARILGEPSDWPQSRPSVQTAFSQMELGAQATAGARTAWEQARPAMQALGQSGGAGVQSAVALHGEAMRLIATARTAGGVAWPGAGGASTGDFNAFRGLKAHLLVHTRAMEAAVGFHQVVAASWADFRDIELQAASLDAPAVADPAARLAEQAAALEVQANEALAAIRNRPPNPCDGYASATPADAQTQWDAIRQAAQSMTGAAEQRAQRLSQDLSKRQLLLGETQAEAQKAQAGGRRDLVTQARRLEQELRTTIQNRQDELGFIGARLGPIKQTLGGLGP